MHTPLSIHRWLTLPMHKFVTVTENCCMYQQHDNRGAADRGDVPRVLHLQRAPLDPPHPPRRLDILHPQDRLQGNLHRKGELIRTCCTIA